MVSLAILICTHNRPEGLARLLASVAPQVRDWQNRRVVVYNDGTHDSRYDAVLARHADLANLSYEFGKERIGIARARTETVRRSESDYIVFIDDDCAAPPHWLDWLEARLGSYPEIDVIAGTTKPMDPEKARFVGQVQIAFDLLPHPHTHPGGLRSFVTACLAIRRSSFLQVGGFGGETTFATAGEDTDLSLRLGRSRARILVDEAWWVWHSLAQSFGEEYRRHRRYGFANGMMAVSPLSSDAFGYHFEREKLNPVQGFLEHFKQTRALPALEGLSLSRRLAMRLAHAAIRLSFDQGASDAIRGDRDSRRLGRLGA